MTQLFTFSAAAFLFFFSPSALFTEDQPGLEFDPNPYAGEHWYGVYLLGEKIGFGRWSLEKTSRGGATVWKAGLKLSYRLALGGEKREMGQEEERTYRPGAGLIEFSARNSSILGTTSVSGIRNGSRFVITTDSSREVIPAREETLADYLSDLILVRSKAPVGAKISSLQFSPSLFRWITIIHTVGGIERVYLNGVATRIYRIESSFPELGISTESFIDENLHTIESRVGEVLTIREEGADQARNLDYETDLLRLTAVKAANPPGRPRQTKSLLLRLNGIGDPDLIISSPRQRYRPISADSYYLWIESGEPDGSKPSPEIPIADPELAPYLASSPYIQSSHPEIEELARAVAGGEENSRKVAGLLSGWIHKNLEKTFLTAPPSARTVLREKKGDCKAHSVLFVALARNLGLPARQVSGLVLMEDGKFYYHQWAEAFLGRWIGVDPVFDQLPVDATHLKLSEGDPQNQIRLLKLIGELSIEVLEVPPGKDSIFFDSKRE